MKYAFIVLIAIYLVTYGCNTDKSEDTHSSHEQTATTALEHPPQNEMTAEPAAQHEPAVQEESAVQHEPAPAVAADTHEHQTAPEEPAAAPQAAESEQVVMPCGKTMAKDAIPENAPCRKMEEQGMIDTPDDEELAVAMQRMVDTTNGVIEASKELVTATYLMLSASQEMAKESGEPEEGASDDGSDQQVTEQAVAEQEVETALEQEVVETMQQFISAARDVIDATNQAIYQVVEEKQQ